MNTIDVDASKWVRRYQPSEGAAPRLVCFPHAGGSASFYHPVAMAHAPKVDVVALQYPGRQDRRHEPPIADIDEYADRISAVIESMPDAPSVFFGHSMGAVLAFEVAYRLEQRSANPPRSLLLSGRRAPCTSRDERVHQSGDEGIIAELMRLNGTDSAVLGDEDILRMSLPAIRNDYRATETYPCRPDRAVRCPITVLVGDDDPKTTLDEAVRWREHTTGAFRMRRFTGGHFYLSSHAGAVNDEIAAELDAISVGDGR